MPPTIIVTDLSPAELLGRAVDNARKASAEIDRLFLTNLDRSIEETIMDRALAVAKHARVLSEAWAIIDSLLQMAADELPDDEQKLDHAVEVIEGCGRPDCAACRAAAAQPTFPTAN